MEIYLVGGAVRDKLLGLPVEERDWVVVGASPQHLLDLGYKQIGKDFPVFLHPQTKEEYALARTERKTGHGYKGFEFYTDPDVTLEQDLKRRDLTINAIAQSADGDIIDPYGGQGDLAAGRLRHISAAFAEDPVRILRVARFAARFGRWGFSVAHDTNALMRKMVDNGEIDYLVAERVWSELAKALLTEQPLRFFTVLNGCRALSTVFPEIAREYRADQAAHGKAPLPDALEALRLGSAHSDDPQIRFAVLLLSLGGDMSTAARAIQAQALCKRIRAPNQYTRLALDAIKLIEALTGNDAEQLLGAMQSSGAFREPRRWRQLLETYRLSGAIDADRARRLDDARERAAEINAAALEDRPLSGPAIGEAIHERRRQAIASAWTATDRD